MFPGTRGHKIIPVNHDFQTSNCVEMCTCVVLSQKKTLTLHEFLKFLSGSSRLHLLYRTMISAIAPPLGTLVLHRLLHTTRLQSPFATRASKNALATSFTMMALVSSLNAESGHFSTVAASDTSNFRASGGREQSVHLIGVEVNVHDPAPRSVSPRLLLMSFHRVRSAPTVGHCHPHAQFFDRRPAELCSNACLAEDSSPMCTETSARGFLCSNLSPILRFRRRRITTFRVSLDFAKRKLLQLPLTKDLIRLINLARGTSILALWRLRSLAQINFIQRRPHCDSMIPRMNHGTDFPIQSLEPNSPSNKREAALKNSTTSSLNGVWSSISLSSST